MNDNTPIATGKDPLFESDLFWTSDAIFISFCLLSNPEIKVVKCIWHPSRPSIKIFYLSPIDVVAKLQQEYRLGRTKVDPQQLKYMQHTVLNWPLSHGSARPEGY